MFYKLNNFVNYYLSQKSKIDGRWLLLGILIVYFIPILIAVFSPNYPSSWSSGLVYPFIKKVLPPFHDMRVITTGYECIRLGYDVLIDNPCDVPKHRTMNYPRIWSVVAKWGLNQSHTDILGILCGLLFLTLVFLIIKRLNYTEALLYGIIVCSPSIMLGAERGNNDLIIFVILAIALLMMQSQEIIWNLFSLGMILLASILKIYPFFAVITLLKQRKQHFILLFSFAITFFFLYVYVNLESLKLVSKGTPRGTNLSYGGKVIYDLVFEPINKIKTDNAIFSTLIDVIHVRYTLFILIALFLFLLYLLLTRSNEIFSKNPNSLNIDQIDSFRIGASIYIGTFLLVGNNWDYRLMFLLFTIPQILLWLKTPSQIFMISGLALISIILSVWLSAQSTEIYYIDELFNWLLFLFFIYTLILTFPEWLKIIMRNKIALFLKMPTIS